MEIGDSIMESLPGQIGSVHLLCKLRLRGGLAPTKQFIKSEVEGNWNTRR